MNIDIRHTISAGDGVSIGWRQLGTGPAVVITHGSLATGEQLLPLAQSLADEYTVYLVDRRGRGLSGDSRTYALDMEIADLQAVLAVAGPGAALFGHSYGAVCAAATAANGADISALVLDEPPLALDKAWNESPLARVADALTAGDNDQALTIIASDLMLIPEPGVEAMRQSPGWAEMSALAQTYPRELGGTNSLFNDLERFKNIRQPTLVVQGGKTTTECIAAVQWLTANLPDATLAVFPHGDHFTPVMDPAGVASAIKSFLNC